MKGPTTPEQKDRIARSKARAALQRWRESGGNPLNTRESRSAINWTLREKGIPAKACSQCFTVKSLASYPSFASSADGLRSYCRDCKAANHATRSATDPVYIQKRRQAAVAYYHANATARREYSIRYSKRKRQANLIKNAAKIQDPNILKRCIGACGRTLPETHFRLDRGKDDGLRARCRDCADSSLRARRACTQEYGGPTGQTCYLCMSTIGSHAQAHADHLHPTSAGGSDEASNIWWTHEFCNIARGARPLTPDEWDQVRSLQQRASAATKEMAS
ncbi:hypothetical protein [Streptomyces microflavus]|uniref:hypothetical protein n=1 Tax=Streptomyces microflavus TaxID=1919 RepID=UPI0033CB3143